MDISTGEGAEKSGERGGTKAAMVVGYESSGRQRGEREESSVRGSRNRDWGNREKPKVRGGGFGSSQERQGRSGSVKDGDRGGGKDSVSVRTEERGDAHKGMRQGRVGEKIAGDGGGLEGKRQFPREVRGTAHREDRAVRKSER